MLWRLGTVTSTVSGVPREDLKSFICSKGFCISPNYSKYDLPEAKTTVKLGIDVIDIPKIDDNDFTVTLVAFFNLLWTDSRLTIDEKTNFGSLLKEWLPQNDNFIQELWRPDLFIRHLKEFRSQDVLSKQEAMWIKGKFRIWYTILSSTTFICPMTFHNYPLDVHVCPFQVINMACIFCR